MNKHLFIYGVPGSGKTYYSQQLKKRSGTACFELDKIKRIARKGKSKKENPFLHIGTCLAYQNFGELNEDNVIRGLLAVREALCPFVIDKIRHHPPTIFEGAFIDPKEICSYGEVKLLVTPDLNKHKRQFYMHREKLLDFKGKEFQSARLIQEYLIKEAKRLKIEIVNND